MCYTSVHLVHLHSVVLLKKQNENARIEGKFLKIAKTNSQQEKLVFPTQSQKLVPAKHKKSPIHKIKLP